MTEIKDRSGKTFNISGPGNVVGKDKDGATIYQDPVYGTKYLDNEEGQEKLRQEFEQKRKLEEQKFMADENVTKFDVLKEKVETLKEDTKNKLLEREKYDKELEQKVDALDKKQCQGEECYTRIEKTQADMMKMMEDRLKRLEEPVYVCSNCNIGTMRKGATECPYCGVKVKTWS